MPVIFLILRARAKNNLMSYPALLPIEYAFTNDAARGIYLDLALEEKEYRWGEAAQSYELKLHSTKLDTSTAAENWQRIGLCYSLAARQARSSNQFKKHLEQAVSAYESAASF